MLRFEIIGLPVGKGAARHNSRGFTYTPTKTRDYMQKIRDAAIKAGAICHDKPCIVRIQALFPVPVSHSKRLQQLIRDGRIPYTKKPDTDNLSKIKDALTGIAFKDDALVYRETITKYYSDTPRLIVEVFYLDHIPFGLGYMK